MMQFRVFKTALTVHAETIWLEPAAIVSVLSQDRRNGYGGWEPVAVITMVHGGEYVVEDSGRNVAAIIAAAKEQEQTP